ncbi:uncharacterized protein LOC123299114 isoform X2 [Chrysoperla carnea]|uniref:uncharacterized protein LOC123299114 isoform X2 n=1 Tax=Chrysoperla carnea TaxID=189513 RepID=UPI001D0600ED|nr:uncharacterized protein LOC123299114 isoform X2 [Chrysoperla carnea]
MWNTIQGYISQIPYFIQYNMEDIQEVIITSKILEFDSEEVILGNGIDMYYEIWKYV